MSKKKILLGLLIAAGAAYVVCKALMPKAECKADEVNSDANVATPEEKPVEKQFVDVEEMVAYVTTPVAHEEAAEASVPTEQVSASDAVADTVADTVVTEEDFVENENA